MSRYCGKNFEINEDCFVKTKNVKSLFIYGNKDYVVNPYFTVFIPTYKRVNFLEEAINSVINQWHTSFPWEIIVVDNEAYNGRQNDTEKLIRKINNKRILYFRNTEHLRPGDNFNRGFLLARGKWVMMLHDDDLLIPNALCNMGNIVQVLEKISRKPLGAISTKYYQFTYDSENPTSHILELNSVKDYYINHSQPFALYKLTHNNIIFTGNIGGDIPSNGATYCRNAVLEVGGFNDDLGISADLVLYYCLEKKYDVYSTVSPYGFYRWGSNTMSKYESIYNTINNNKEFREYVYSRNILYHLWGVLFNSSQYRKFVVQVIKQRKKSINENLSIDSFNSIYEQKPNKHVYAFYSIVISKVYEQYKINQMTRLYKKIMRELN